MKELKKAVESLSRARNAALIAHGVLIYSLNDYLKNHQAKELARDIGISAQYLNDIVHLRREISHEVLIKLRKATAQ